jgi:hypothetical protein
VAAGLLGIIVSASSCVVRPYEPNWHGHGGYRRNHTWRDGRGDHHHHDRDWSHDRRRQRDRYCRDWDRNCDSRRN